MNPISKMIVFRNIINMKDLLSFIDMIIKDENFVERIFIHEVDNSGVEEIELFINKLYINTVVVNRIIERLKQHKSAV